LQGITASVEELSASNQEVHSKVGGIHAGSLDVAEMMKEAESFTKELQTTTENMQEKVSRFKIGEGYLEALIFKVRSVRDQVQERIEKMSRQGINVFDQNYQPIPGTDPKKYNTAYDALFDRELRPYFDRLLQEIKGGRFVVPCDTNGYVPTHNSQFSKPLTGDHQTDLLNSRDKRLFNDPTGIRAARNTKSFLLQTYMRDTGEILNDLSMPILVGGRHWGGLRIGFDPKVLLEE
jgi:methyl-accepting chemotaxis protein